MAREGGDRTDYRGFPSKRYSVFFQRPREKLTENNRKLGTARFQTSFTAVVRAYCIPGVQLQRENKMHSTSLPSISKSSTSSTTFFCGSDLIWSSSVLKS